MTKKLISTLAFLSAFYIYSAAADVNVAVIAPVNGEFEAFGKEIISGVKIAVDSLNEHGGLHGQKVNLITVDDPCDDHFAVSTAQMMAVNSSKEDKVNLVIGPYCFNSFQQVSEIYAKADIFQIIPTTVNLQNAQTHQKGLVKMVGTKETQAQSIYNYYQKNLDGQNLALVYDSADRDIVDIALALQAKFVKDNNRDKLKVFNFSGYKNIGKISDDILSQNIKTAYIMGKPKKIAQLSKMLKKENNQFAIFTNRYQANEEYAKIIGSYAEGSYYVALPSLKDNPDFTETLVKLRLLGIEPEGLGVYGYSAVTLWEDLVTKANSFSYNKLSKALENNSFETPWGEMIFNNGNPDNSINYSIYQLNSGEYTQVY